MSRLHIVSHAVAALLACSVIVPYIAAAQASNSSESSEYVIAAGQLAEVLSRYAAAAGVALTFSSEQTRDRHSPGLRGRYTLEGGFDALLEGTGLQAVKSGEGTYTLQHLPPQSAAPAMTSTNAQTLRKISVEESELARSLEQPAPAYSGNQVARGVRLGMLGSRDIMATPFNVTSYTSELMSNQQAYSVGDVLANDPSVRNPYSRGGETDEFITRGFLTYNRDIAFNGLYGILPFSTVPVEILDRVEVIKGPAAMLNGMPPSGTIGGTVSVTPKRAGADPVTRFTATVSSASLLSGHVDVARRFGDDQQLGVRFNGVYRGGDLAVDHTDESLAVAMLGFDHATERVRTSIDVGYQNRELDAQQTFLFNFLVEPGVPAPAADTNWVQPWTYWDYETVFGTVRTEFDISQNVSAYAAVGAKNEDSDSVQTTMSLRDAAGTIRAFPSHIAGYQDAVTAEAGLRAAFETGPIGHSIALSTSVYDEEAGTLSASSPTAIFSNLYAPVTVERPAFPGFSDIPRTRETKLQGVALADTLSVLDERVMLTLGLRHQTVEAASYQTTGSRISRYRESALTPAVGLVLRPWQANVSLYANYIEGLSQGPTAPTTAANAGQVFEPYESEQYEAGVKVDFGTFATTLGLFQISQPNSFTDPVTNVFGLDGEQRNRGIELNVFGELRDDLRLLGGAAYTDAELTQTRAGLNEGNTAVGVPAVQVNVAAEWDASFLSALTLSSRLIYTSSQYLNAANTQEISSWTRWDIGARYALGWGAKPIMLRLNVENVLDRDYWSSTSREGLYLGAPRTFLISATFDF